MNTRPAGTVSAPSSVAIRAEPIDPLRCRFVAGVPLYPDRWAYFGSPERAAGAPLAARLFALPGVTAVLIAHDKVTVTRADPGGGGLPVLGAAWRFVRRLTGDPAAGAETWPALARAVGAAVREHLASGALAVSRADPSCAPSAEELRARVQRVLDDEVNPVVAGHGGGVSVVNVIDNVVYLAMSGGCQGCGLADLTLRHGVEAALRDAVPEVGEIVDLTDHAAGRSPFVRAPGRAVSPFPKRTT